LARWRIASERGKPLHSTERAKQVTVHYRWHPLYGQIARVRRGVPRSTGDVLFCELPDGATGALPAWMTDAAACAALTVGAKVVSIATLQELRELLDAVAPRARVQATGASGAGDAPHDEQGRPQRRLIEVLSTRARDHPRSSGRARPAGWSLTRGVPWDPARWARIRRPGRPIRKGFRHNVSG
jgi:hypothetical protein